MSAQIYSPPESIHVPELNFSDFNIYEEESKKFKEDLKAFCLKRKKGKNVGEIISFPVADGTAEYMVASVRPLELIHIPLMDGYEFQYAHLMTAKEVNKKIENQKALAKLFS